MKIVKLTAENFMRLVAVEISPQGNAILITGKNGAGKSCLIEAIKSLFRGKKYHPEKPIRDGADHAEIVGETEYFIIKRTFTKAGGDSVTVTNTEGMEASSPQGLLDKFYGEIAFEPMKFYKDGKSVGGRRQQRDMLMKLVGLDFADIDLEIGKVKVLRSAVKTNKETYDFEAGQITVPDDTPDELVSMAELTEKLRAANQLNEKHAETVRHIDVGQKEVEDFTKRLSNSNEAIATLKQQLAFHEQQKANNEKALEEAQVKQEELVKTLEPLIDVTPINTELVLAESTNNQVRGKHQRKELLKKSAGKSREFAELGKKTKALEAKKAERLAAAKMPIDKLSVNEETILYDNIPLAQVNDSMQLRIAVAMSMALNPKLKVILMKGNDLDSASLETVCKLADEKDYQVWIEKVSDDKKNKTGFIIEDGSVVEADKDVGVLEAAEKVMEAAKADKDVLFKDKE